MERHTSPRTRPRSAALRALLPAVSALSLLAAVPAHAQKADELPLPTRLAIIPFRCVRECPEMPTLQSALVDQLVDKNTFEMLMTPDMADLLLQRADVHADMDSLTARAARGVEPDSATAAPVLKRLKVDGFLYASQGAFGPSVAIWSIRPRPGEVFRYQAGKSTRGFLPETHHEGAQTKGAQFSTGGAQASGGSTPSGSGSGGGKSSGEPTAQMPTQYTREVTLMNTSESSDERMGSMAEKIATELHKILHPHPEKDAGSQ